MAKVSPRVAISALFALDGAVIGGWLAHIPDAQAALHLTKGELGGTLLFSSLGALLAMSQTGTLVHRFGNRRVCLWGCGAVLSVVPWIFVAPSRAWLAAILVALGATNGTLDVAMNDHAVGVQSHSDRPVLSSVHGWWSLGGFVGGAGTALANRLHVLPRDHLLFASIVLALVLVGLAKGLLPDEPDKDDDEARFALPSGRLLGLGLLALLALFAEGALLDWSAVYFRDGLGSTATIAALGFGVGSGAMALGRLMGDRLVEGLGQRDALRWSGWLTSLGLLIAVATDHPVGAFFGFALTGLGLANSVPILFAAAATVPGVSASAGIAAVASLGYAAFLGGPPLIGSLAQATSLQVGLGCVGLLAALIAVFGPKVVETDTTMKTPGWSRDE